MMLMRPLIPTPSRYWKWNAANDDSNHMLDKQFNMYSHAGQALVTNRCLRFVLVSGGLLLWSFFRGGGKKRAREKKRGEVQKREKNWAGGKKGIERKKRKEENGAQ